MKNNNNNGFTLIEILIAVAILSMILIGVFSGISSSINSVSQSKNFTRAMLIARTEMNDFIINRMRGADIVEKKSENYEEFTFSRKTEKVTHPLLELLNAQKTKIVVSWKQKSRTYNYSLFYIYPKR